MHQASYKSRARFYLTQTTDPPEEELDPPLVGIINFVTESDCLIILSTEVFESDEAALAYSVYIRACMLAGGSMSIDGIRVVPIIVSDEQVDSEPAYVQLINHRFSRRLELSYVSTHGRSFSVPQFKLGKYRWFSQDVTTGSDIGGGQVFDNAIHFSVRKLMRDLGLSYGDEPDDVPPPRLVWMDHCASAGSSGLDRYGFAAPQNASVADTDLSWANCFGIAPEMTQGVFLGWSGAIPVNTDLAPASTVWRAKMWYFTLVDKRNIGVTLQSNLNMAIPNTAIERTDFFTRQLVPTLDQPNDPVVIHRAYGQWQTSF